MVASLLTGIPGSVRAESLTVHDSTLAPYRIVDGAIPDSLTGVAGDPVKGKAVAIDRKLGNCLSCHAMPVSEADQGNVGPNLSGSGQLSIGQLRLRIVNAKSINPSTVMPAYYRVTGLHHVDIPFRNKTMLSAQQVEDVVAYLHTLK